MTIRNPSKPAPTGEEASEDQNRKPDLVFLDINAGL
jgi:hypothetical protein